MLKVQWIIVTAYLIFVMSDIAPIIGFIALTINIIIAFSLINWNWEFLKVNYIFGVWSKSWWVANIALCPHKLNRWTVVTAILRFKSKSYIAIHFHLSTVHVTHTITFLFCSCTLVVNFVSYSKVHCAIIVKSVQVPFFILSCLSKVISLVFLVFRRINFCWFWLIKRLFKVDAAVT